jgi:hypothetical protein
VERGVDAGIGLGKSRGYLALPWPATRPRRSGGRTVVVETYPAEFYRHLGIDLGQGGKRSQAARRAAAFSLLRWADDAGVDVAPASRNDIEDGFGEHRDGEEPFDATVGLFGMLNVVLGRRAPGEPEDGRTRKIEGWMLGQAVGS